MDKYFLLNAGKNISVTFRIHKINSATEAASHFTLQILHSYAQNPKINFSEFDFIVSPNHDKIDGIINDISLIYPPLSPVVFGNETRGNKSEKYH